MKNELLIIFFFFFFSSILSAKQINELTVLSISNSSILLECFTEDSIKAKLHYGLNPWDLEFKREDKLSAIRHQYFINNLKSNQRYYFQALYNNFSDSKLIKIPEIPLIAKTILRNSPKFDIISAEPVSFLNNKILVKILLSDPALCEIYYGNNARTLKMIKKSDFFDTTHLFIIPADPNGRTHFYNINIKNIINIKKSLSEASTINLNSLKQNSPKFKNDIFFENNLNENDIKIICKTTDYCAAELWLSDKKGKLIKQISESDIELIHIFNIPANAYKRDDFITLRILSIDGVIAESKSYIISDIIRNKK